MSPQPVTVWSALAVAQAVAGGITWIDPTNLQPNVDALNLYWDSVNKRMSVATAGDYSGTDAINSGGQVDSYVPIGIAPGPGFSASTSRGSRVTPLINADTDPLGQFSFYGYTQTGGVDAIPAWRELAGIKATVNGSDVYDPGASLDFYIKPNNGVLTKILQIRYNTGGGQLCFQPAASIGSGAVQLGNTGARWGRFWLNSTNAGATGNIQIDMPTGSVQFAAGTQTLTLTNSNIAATSIVICTVATDDATAFACKAIVAAGSATLKLNAACTGQTKVSFLVVS